MSDTEAPKIEFPCDYPIKIMGEAGPDFQKLVTDVVKRHASEVTDDVVKVRESRNARYLAVTITIVATGQLQLEAIFEDLKKTGRVTMVL